LHGRLLVAMLLLVSACVGQRFVTLSPGQTIEEAGARYEAPMRRPFFMLGSDAGEIALFGVDSEGDIVQGFAVPATVLVFDAGRYACILSPQQSVQYSECLRQPEGPALLAERLRALCAGQPDPLARIESAIPVAELRCPRPPMPQDRSALPEQKEHSPIAQGMAETLFYSAGIILSPIILPAGLAWMGGAAAADQPGLRAQERIALGQDGDAVNAIMGEPSRRLVFDPARIEVRCYERKLNWGFCVGLLDGRVAWYGSSAWMLSELQRARTEENNRRFDEKQRRKAAESD
jgi:hypothetical protein